MNAGNGYQLNAEVLYGQRRAHESIRISSAESIKAAGLPVVNQILLQKKVFPNRRIPHRVKREYKEQAMRAIENRKRGRISRY